MKNERKIFFIVFIAQCPSGNFLFRIVYQNVFCQTFCSIKFQQRELDVWTVWRQWRGENGKFNFHNWWSVKPRLGWTLFSFTVVKMSTKTQKKEWEAKLNILIESSMLMFMYLVATKMIDPLHTEHFLSSVKIDIWETVTGGAVIIH